MSKRHLRERITAPRVRRASEYCKECGAEIDADLYVEALCDKCRKKRRDNRLRLLKRRETRL